MSVRVDCELAICSDCMIWLANGDDSGMSPEQSSATLQGERDLISGIYGAHIVVDGEELGFSTTRCDCCNGLAGDRFRAAVLVPFSPFREEDR